MRSCTTALGARTTLPLAHVTHVSISTAWRRLARSASRMGAVLTVAHVVSRTGPKIPGWALSHIATAAGKVGLGRSWGGLCSRITELIGLAATSLAHKGHVARGRLPSRLSPIVSAVPRDSGRLWSWSRARARRSGTGWQSASSSRLYLLMAFLRPRAGQGSSFALGPGTPKAYAELRANMMRSSRLYWACAALVWSGSSAAASSAATRASIAARLGMISPRIFMHSARSAMW